MQNRILPLVILLSLILSSCSLTFEKRHYRKGYHVEEISYKSKRNPGRQVDNRSNRMTSATIQTENNALESIAAPITTVQQKRSSTNPKSPLYVPNIEKVKTANDKSSLVQVELNQKVDSEINKLPWLIKRKNKLASENILHVNKIKAIKSANPAGLALLIIGIIFLIAGLILLIFISILIGIILMGVGLILLIVGIVLSTSGNKKPDNVEYVDVVYLKNGSIIRGLIIEQTPNVSLKIQTADKSTFVYSMDEVEKITKEPKR
jgi:hypothetical protein